MATTRRGRTYADRCGIARALDLVGERWALLVVRELLLGPKRFTDLRRGMPALGPDVLSQRLRELERAGIVERRRLAPPAASRVYALTGRGRELEPVVLALGRWGSAAPLPGGEPAFGADSAMLALKTMFDPERARGLELELEFRLGPDRYRAAVSAGGLELERGEAEAPAATIATDPRTLAELAFRGADLERERAKGSVELEGDAAGMSRFLALFAPRSEG